MEKRDVLQTIDDVLGEKRELQRTISRLEAQLRAATSQTQRRRDRFAAAALTGILSRGREGATDGKKYVSDLAEASFIVADAMLAASSPPEEEEKE